MHVAKLIYSDINNVPGGSRSANKNVKTLEAKRNQTTNEKFRKCPRAPPADAPAPSGQLHTYITIN